MIIRWFLFTVVLFPTFLFGQGFTIAGVNTDSIFIGLDNALMLEGYARDDAISVQVGPEIRAKKRGRHTFSLHVSRPLPAIPLLVLKDEVVVDTIVLSAHRLRLDQFIIVNNFGLIKSGAYNQSILLQMEALSVTINVPEKRIPILAYDIEIIHKADVILKNSFKGFRLDEREIVQAIGRMVSGDKVSIYNIRARLPWDDGQQPTRFELVVK